MQNGKKSIVKKKLKNLIFLILNKKLYENVLTKLWNTNKKWT